MLENETPFGLFLFVDKLKENQMMMQRKKQTRNLKTAMVIAVVVGLLLTHAPAKADNSINSLLASHSLSQALAAPQRAQLFGDGKDGRGFSLLGSFFSNNNSSPNYAATNSSLGLNHAADLAGDQRVYALLVDGKYDFNYDNTDTASIHPYLAGGVGMAMYGQPAGSTNTLSSPGGDLVPLLRLGGGVTYRLDEKWNMSLDYKAGVSGHNSATDRLFTGRGQEPLDLQMLNMGLKYKF